MTDPYNGVRSMEFRHGEDDGALPQGAPTCPRCGAVVHDPCDSDFRAADCDLPDSCFPKGRKVTSATVRVPKVRTSHHRNAEEAARLQALVNEKFAPAAGQSLNEQAKDHPRYDNPRDPFASPDRLPPRDEIVPAGRDLNAETIQTLLDLLNPLHGELDRQTYDDKVREDFDAPRGAEYNVNITAQMERDLTQAVMILENRKRDPQAPSPAGAAEQVTWWESQYALAQAEIERLRAKFKAKEAGWNETVRLYNQVKAELQAFREAVATIPPVPSTEGSST